MCFYCSLLSGIEGRLAQSFLDMKKKKILHKKRKIRMLILRFYVMVRMSQTTSSII